ncbi:Lrp/AsnC family transcriptional regulator [Salinactinospora qingdaonensis]|uniref:Lrp/AsnC family transcriptional regulator n=1 Tax=Salinactinospora qingdaonensis TaxID=702744 RepID=A0ABP7FB54_9ACTN
MSTDDDTLTREGRAPAAGKGVNVRLDTTDLALVAELQQDGRLPFETLASRVGLSRAAVRSRIQRMTAMGAIRITGVVHPHVREITARAHLSIHVDTPAAPLAGKLAALDSTETVTLTAGRFPLRAEVGGGDMDHLAEAIERVRSLPGVREVDPLIYTEVMRDPYQPSTREPPRMALDDIDGLLLAALERDGRSSFAELATVVGLSPGAVRSRVLRMLEASVVRVVALADPRSLGVPCAGGFALRCDSGGRHALDDIAQWPELWFLGRCLGRADAIGHVATGSAADLHALYERVRALSGVHVTETWVDLEPVRYRYRIATADAGGSAVARERGGGPPAE